jgi:Gly-Xaa carboxypeptidase
LSEALLSAFGGDSFAFIIDEGGMFLFGVLFRYPDDLAAGGFTEMYGSVFATPGIAEKGYLDVRVEVTAPGGHSSVPPHHTVSQKYKC